MALTRPFVGARKVSYPGGRVGFVEDRLAVLSGARPWAMSSDAVVAAFDQAQALAVEVDAVLLGLVREIEARGIPAGEGASSMAAWIRDRHRVAVRAAHRLVPVAAELDAAPAVLGEAVAAGLVTRDQAEVILRSLARLPRDLGPEMRDRAAAALVEFCAEHRPGPLGLIGEQILQRGGTGGSRGGRTQSPGGGRGDGGGEAVRHPLPGPDGIGVRLAGLLTAEGAAAVRAAIGPLSGPAPATTGRPGSGGPMPWSRCASWP